MMSRPEFEALYGGAAGGGKSDYLVGTETSPNPTVSRNHFPKDLP